MYANHVFMNNHETDKKAAISAAPDGADRGESVGLMEPLLIAGSSKYRTGLTDLAVELAARSAGFRRSLPEGVLTALSYLVRSMKSIGILVANDERPTAGYQTAP